MNNFLRFAIRCKYEALQYASADDAVQQRREIARLWRVLRRGR